MQIFIKELIKLLKPGVDVNQLKKDLCKRYKIKQPPSNIEILNHLTKEQRGKYRSYFITKPSRTISGVVPLAVMTKPLSCPHGKCIYCPGGPNSEFGNVPQSYTGKEPASMRAERANYDSYLQIFNRLEQYIVLGQIPEKCDVIVMGGTFPSFEKKYREEFIKYVFKAMNDFSKLFFKKNELHFEKFKKFFELPGSIEDNERTARIQEKIRALRKDCSLIKEQKKNEKANIRCIGLTIETRPDYGTLKEGNEMLRLGCTRVEIGIESTDENVLKFANRGHTINDTKESIRTLKDLAFKINAHVMPGLPGSSIKKDIEMLNELFENDDFKPDMLKIYPCIVMKGTKLYGLWKEKKYKPLTTKQAAHIIAEFKKDVPKYVRIMRVNRDIPTYRTEAGVDVTNLRQYVFEIMKKRNYKCSCIRCREAGRVVKIGKVCIDVYEYTASKSREFFISAVDTNNTLIGFCRLRFPSQFLRKEITKKSALIRELHVYSEAVAIGEHNKNSLQHKGYGKKLVAIAEKIAKENGRNKILAISGIGAREYYKKLGYKIEGHYMGKRL